MCWKPEYLILIIVSTLIDYFAAIMMGRHKEKKKRKKYLILSLISNLGILFAFKYFNFVSQSLSDTMNLYNIFYEMPYFHALLPVGISFYTFQTLGYSIDVYRGDIKPEKHLGIFALYVSFFPQLVAGPIERSTHLMPQFSRKNKFEYSRLVSGLRLMLWGFFKKMAIADQLAPYVDAVYNNPGSYSGLPLLIATYLFGIQIYCDFSGYSDIAIGSARILGYDLMHNFNMPYWATSIRDFWSRWHISLTTWFRDYLYIPLGGGRVDAFRKQFNITVVFLLSALWHGANWTFVMWGVMHSLYYFIGYISLDFRKKVARLLGLDKFPFAKDCLSIFITFNLVSFAWIFFRANSISNAYLIIKNMFYIKDLALINSLNSFKLYLAAVDVCKWGISFYTACMLLAFATLLIFDRKDINYVLEQKSVFFKWPWYYFVMLFILILGTNEQSAFIYFQF
jgi:D-alanyl-lipoteichoic acid acyltransferase DltB (MBOAT superfamily)